MSDEATPPVDSLAKMVKVTSAIEPIPRYLFTWEILGLEEHPDCTVVLLTNGDSIVSDVPPNSLATRMFDALAAQQPPPVTP